MEWKPSNYPCKKNFKCQPSTGKLILTFFWDSQDVVVEHFKERCETINSACYIEPAIRSKRRGLLSKLLSHDNARLHTAAHNVETLHKHNFEVIHHSPYSPVLVKSYFYLFGPFKALRGRICTLDETVEEAMHSWIAVQPKHFL
ncbi:hypothetical protein LAZ67_X001444 [Cordylochernes scorpioides]|uniref:Transposase n=1 Tax=Cordylochernes scorpioides TaxID=51811 RepID=A0ABY6LSE7_9ARAC|nr:hypothetical protein LAZ67_X001444 [Cordylochernes scorpioides]